MKIGIKYCGGCNPRYNRKQFFIDLVENFKEGYECEVAKEVTIYDVAVIICGCSNCCASIEDISVRGDIIYVSENSQLKEIIDTLKNPRKDDNLDEIRGNVQKQISNS